MPKLKGAEAKAIVIREFKKRGIENITELNTIGSLGGWATARIVTISGKRPDDIELSVRLYANVHGREDYSEETGFASKVSQCEVFATFPEATQRPIVLTDVPELIEATLMTAKYLFVSTHRVSWCQHAEDTIIKFIDVISDAVDKELSVIAISELIRTVIVQEGEDEREKDYLEA
jgi:hypothetical protein